MNRTQSEPNALRMKTARSNQLSVAKAAGAGLSISLKSHSGIHTVITGPARERRVPVMPN